MGIDTFSVLQSIALFAVVIVIIFMIFIGSVQQHLAQDIAPAKTKVIFATQHPTHAGNVDGKVSVAAWMTKPSWYVVSEQDRMIQPDLRTAMTQKISAKVTILPAGHTPHISQPSEVAEVILEAIAHVTR